MKKYTIGKGKAPEWCRRFLLPYRGENGTLEYEFYGRTRIEKVRNGDVLVKDKGSIHVKRKKGSYEKS